MPPLVFFRRGVQAVIAVKAHSPESRVPQRFLQFLLFPGALVLSFKKHSDNLLAGKTVMLDAGHGGLYMTGTALRDQSTAEKKTTLSGKPFYPFSCCWRRAC